VHTAVRFLKLIDLTRQLVEEDKLPAQGQYPEQGRKPQANPKTRRASLSSGCGSQENKDGDPSHTPRTHGPTLRLAWTTPSPDRDRRLGRLPLVLCWVPSPRICGTTLCAVRTRTREPERRLAHPGAHFVLSRRNILALRVSWEKRWIPYQWRHLRRGQGFFVFLQLARTRSRALDVCGSGAAGKQRMQKIAPLLHNLRRCLMPTKLSNNEGRSLGP